MLQYQIRTIQPQDNKEVESVIRTCLIEYGANHEGTAWADPDLGKFSEVYAKPASEYWVATVNSKVVAGVGIGPLLGAEGVCELQKMYCLKEYRGAGIANALIQKALDFAQKYYDRCYLETLPNMLRAQAFYECHGFTRTMQPLVTTEHFACDVRYIKDL